MSYLSHQLFEHIYGFHSINSKSWSFRVPLIFFLLFHVLLFYFHFYLSFLATYFHSLLLTSLTNLTSNHFVRVSNTFSFIRLRFSKFSYVSCIVSYLLFIYTFNYNLVSCRYFYFYSFWIF